MNQATKEIVTVYEKLNAKGKAAVLRRARRLLARQTKQIAAPKGAATNSAQGNMR